jgi:hypothetical protein
VLFNKAVTLLIQYPAGRAGEYTMPISVTSIGQSAFAGCSKLSRVVFSNQVTSISGFAFIGCSGLSSVAIPEGVSLIRSAVFAGCTGLVSVTIPNGVTGIDAMAFDRCTSLTSINIPASVTFINGSAFARCTSLMGIHVDGSNSIYASLDGVLFNKEFTELLEYPTGRTGEYTIPSGVVTIGQGAFYNHENLTRVVIPESVTLIAYGAFSGCKNLKEVVFLGNAPSMGDWVFSDVADEFTIYYNAGAVGFSSPTWNGLPAIRIFVEVDLTDQAVSHSGGSYAIGVSATTSWSVDNKPDWVSVSPLSGSGNATLTVEVEANSRSISRQGIINIAGIEHVITQYGDTRDFSYVDNGDDIRITGYTGSGGDVEVPDFIDGKPVHVIGMRAFAMNQNITNVFIPSSIIVIGETHFMHVNC